MIRTTSTIVACALGTSVLAAAAMQSGQQRQQQLQQNRSAQHEKDYEVTTLEGKIVDLYHFMKANDEDRKNLESAAYNGQSTGGPVALVVVRDRTILPDTEDVYIILGAPEEMGWSGGQSGQQRGQQMQMQMMQQELQQSFTRLGIDQQQAQQLAQQLAQGIQREQPSQQVLQQMLQREFTRAGASQQQAQQEAQRVAPQIQQNVTREGQPGLPGLQQQMQMMQQELQQSFIRLGIDQQQAQQLAQQLAQGIQREQPSQQELRDMLQKEFTRAGVSEQRAQQEAKRVAPQIQQYVSREGQPGQRDSNARDRDLADQHQRAGDVQINEICKRAMAMVGQNVRISGMELERDNLQAIVARDIQSISSQTSSNQRHNRDRNPQR